MALFLLGSSSVCEAPAFTMVGFLICDFIIPRLKHTKKQGAHVLQGMERPQESLCILGVGASLEKINWLLLLGLFSPNYTSVN
jgi:hypothetical protein